MSLKLSFHICQMGVKIATTSSGSCKNSMNVIFKTVLGVGQALNKITIFTDTLVIFVSLRSPQCSTNPQLLRRRSLTGRHDAGAPGPPRPRLPRCSGCAEVFIPVSMSSWVAHISSCKMKHLSLQGPSCPKPVTASRGSHRGSVPGVPEVYPKGLKGSRLVRRELRLQLGSLSTYSGFT